MKKKYQRPQSSAVSLHTEPLMALSGTNESLGGDQLSNKQTPEWDDKQWAWDDESGEE